ncbi:MAG: type III pantothenate kinase [Saprospiraceae bacterium]|nr:type III pantothenate kinase [Saprospiraceae bacterium]
MSISLAFDAGNSRVKYGVFQDKVMISDGVVTRWNAVVLDELIEKFSATHVILSSTRHLTIKMRNLFKVRKNYMLLDSDSRLPFENNYESPSTLGKDRIASVAAASSLHPGEASLIIDAGTCITYDLLDSTNSYLGGNISPGLLMRLRAMHEMTDQLPQVGLSDRLLTMGVDTISALQVGVQMGTVLEMRGFIDHYSKIFKKLNILLTGGDAPFFVKRLKTKIFAAPHLVLQGLNEILNYNVHNVE